MTEGDKVRAISKYLEQLIDEVMPETLATLVSFCVHYNR